jgi:hypothetical protein
MPSSLVDSLETDVCNGMLRRTKPEGSVMSKLQSQLALFGAIDQEVVDAKTRLREGATGAEADTDSAILDLVGRFIPGATRFGQSGWYQELQVLVANTARHPAQCSVRGRQ